MANRLHIVSDNQTEKKNPNRNSGLNIGLQEYISDLLIEPVKEKKSSLLKAIEKKENEVNLKTATVEKNIHDIPESKPLQNIALKSNPTNQMLEIEDNDIKIRDFSEPDPRLEKVSRLLERIATQPSEINTNNTEQQSESLKDEKVEISVEDEHKKSELIKETSESSFTQRENQSLRDSLDENFQTLIFDVNNLPLAVPLIKLGGIVDISEQEITPLVGTPDWFLGLVPNERGNLMVVDTQIFLMPERKIKDERNYDYLIVLDNSQWALACHNVGDAKHINASDIRWSSKSSKRPWFAGMVVEYMSALIEVDSLINLLADQVVD